MFFSFRVTKKKSNYMFMPLLNKGRLNDVDLFILIFIMIAVIHMGGVYLISK